MRSGGGAHLLGGQSYSAKYCIKLHKMRDESYAASNTLYICFLELQYCLHNETCFQHSPKSLENHDTLCPM